MQSNQTAADAFRARFQQDRNSFMVSLFAECSGGDNRAKSRLGFVDEQGAPRSETRIRDQFMKHLDHVFGFNQDDEYQNGEEVRFFVGSFSDAVHESFARWLSDRAEWGNASMAWVRAPIVELVEDYQKKFPEHPFEMP